MPAFFRLLLEVEFILPFKKLKCLVKAHLGYLIFVN